MDKVRGYQLEVSLLRLGSNEASGLSPCHCYFASVLSHQRHINSVRCKRQYLGETISNRAHVGRESLYMWQGVGAFPEVGEKETVGQF